MTRACKDVCGLAPSSSHLLMLRLVGTPYNFPLECLFQFQVHHCVVGINKSVLILRTVKSVLIPDIVQILD
jgi:hypothetical protein